MSLFKEGLRSIFVPPKNQIPALDGLRAFAVLLVLSNHCRDAFVYMKAEPNWFLNLPIVRGGWIGVDLFFVLSGFFIGKQLWKEFAQNASVNVPRFILRRGLRIWPLYYVIFFLSACSLWIKNGALPDLWPELLLISNYVPGVIVPGSWSLATEEQFYLTVPTLILILSFFTSSIKNLRWIFYGIFLIAPVVRFLVWQQVDVSGSSEHSAITQHIYFPFHTHMDGLIMGMILSNLLTDTQLRAHRFLKYPLLFLPVAVVIAFFLKKSNGIIFEYTGLALIFGSLVWICLRSQNNFLIRFLSWRGFYTVSKLSYGMYLLHQFCLPVALNVGLVRLDGMSLTVQFTAAFLVNVVASMGLAILGTVLIEHPFLRLRSRLGISS